MTFRPRRTGVQAAADSSDEATEKPIAARELVLLGTGTSHGVPMVGCRCEVCLSTEPRNKRMRSGVLVRAPEGNFVIDTSPELRVQLLREDVDCVHAAVFTHGHADHIFGLDDLRLFGYYLKRAIPLYADEITEGRIRQSFDYAFSDPWPNAHPGATPKFDLRRIGLEPFDVLGVTLHPIRLWHGELPVLGFRLGDVAFCTDVSRIPEESWPLLEGLDTLILDALRDKPHPTHFSLHQALEVVERVRPKRAYFTHISHALEYATTNARLPEGVALAHDGLRIPF
jgi:phosphoribosyl 1,2-cyclic phosphate phosphodiesterase